MKQQYRKPLIAIERYELTQTIASCSIKIGFLDKNCVLKDPDSTAEMRNRAVQNNFTAGACVKSVISGSDEDGICYHTNLNAAFNS